VPEEKHENQANRKKYQIHVHQPDAPFFQNGVCDFKSYCPSPSNILFTLFSFMSASFKEN